MVRMVDGISLINSDKLSLSIQVGGWSIILNETTVYPIFGQFSSVQLLNSAEIGLNRDFRQAA